MARALHTRWRFRGHCALLDFAEPSPLDLSSTGVPTHQRGVANRGFRLASSYRARSWHSPWSERRAETMGVIAWLVCQRQPERSSRSNVGEIAAGLSIAPGLRRRLADHAYARQRSKMEPESGFGRAGSSRATIYAHEVRYPLSTTHVTRVRSSERARPSASRLCAGSRRQHRRRVDTHDPGLLRWWRPALLADFRRFLSNDEGPGARHGYDSGTKIVSVLATRPRMRGAFRHVPVPGTGTKLVQRALATRVTLQVTYPPARFSL